MGRYTGTKGNDTFLLSLSSLLGSTVSGGAGYDTLKLASTGAATFSSSNYQSLSGIDALDFSAHATGFLDVRLSSSMMAQTDNAQLTIVSGAGGINNLKAGALGGTVLVAGSGHVNLDNATNNTVSIKSGATVQVHGGNGADTITAAATGSVLDGGAGNDKLNAGAGIDQVWFGTDDRADLVQGFNSAQDTVRLEGSGLAYMSEVLARMKDTPEGAVLDLGNGDRLTLAGLKVADLSAANFTGIMAGAPTIHIAPGTSAVALNAIIAGAGPGATIILDNGNHVFDQAIVIRQDGVTLKGQSETGTIITFAYPAGTGGNGIEVNGGAKTYLDVASANIAKGATSITMADTHGLKAGDTIWIGQDNDAAYLAAHGWSALDPAKSANNPFREGIVEVDHVTGNTVFLKTAIAFDMTAGQAEVYAIDLVKDVHLSDFTVTSNLGPANAFDFVNTHPEFDNNALVRLDGTQNASIAHITAKDAPSLSFDIRTSLSAHVDDLYVDGGHNKGTDGNGYGLQIYETFDSTFTGLEIFNTRHAVLFSAWDAEARNQVHVTATNRDINFHGSEDVDNTVIVDSSVMVYDQSLNTGIGDGFWPIVGDGGTVHAKTDIFGFNTVKFGNAVGSDAADTIYGVDTGATLSGKNGQDVLFGGSGNDILIGGLNKDKMTGGAGSDLFLVRQGDNYDTIKDFQVGPGGDKIVISGAVSVTDLSNLTLTQDGANVNVRYGANSTLILENHTVVEIKAESFVFDPSGSQYGVLF